MPPLTQAGRPFQITTPVAADTLLFERMTGTEGMNALFAFDVDVLVDAATTIDPNQLLGKAATVSMQLEDGSKRYFNGIAVRVGLLGLAAAKGDRLQFFSRYRITICPTLWLLTQTTNSRIFQNLSVPDILKKVLTGINLKVELTKTYQPYNYCVQYRETDFNFFSRLVEQEGIAYFFRQSDGAHTLVLSDSASAYGDSGKVLYFPDRARTYSETHLSDWSLVRDLQSNSVRLWDAHFALPGKNLEAAKPLTGSSSPLLEVYDYPGEYAKWYDDVNKGGGDQGAELQKIFQANSATAATRANELQAERYRVRAKGNVRKLSAGAKFQVDASKSQLSVSHSGIAVFPPCLVLSCTHELDQSGTYRSDGGQGATYEMELTALPLTGDLSDSAAVFTPPRRARKPIVQGPQTAVVVGASGDEILVDKYGRVKVQFPWDREGKKDADSSCWIRVGQVWAGKNWGTAFWPRVGHEVIVDFLEGDPDRPIITGSVYNADNMPPYTLPDNKTQSGVKSRSSLNGTADNFNELRFEDKKGSEEVYFHSEKDYNQVVENNATVKIGSNDSTYCPDGSRTVEIWNNDTLKIGADQCPDGSRTVTIWKDETIKVGNAQSSGSRTTSIWKDETLSVETGNRSTTIKQGNETLTVSQGDRTTTVSQGNYALSIGEGNRSTDISQGNDTLKVDQGNRSTTISSGNDTLTISQGNLEISLSAGKCTISAGTSIELSVAGNSIKIDATGITVKGTQVAVSADATLDLKSPMTTVKGDGMLTVKGGVVQIN